MNAQELTLDLIGRPGRRQEFERVLAETERLVLRTAYRLLGRTEDAQDAAQEVFLRLYKNWDRVEGDPKPWLYRVTVNVCNDFYRRRTPLAEPDLEQRDEAPGPDAAITFEERKKLLMEGLKTLGERERSCVVLREIEGLSTREVAGILGVEEVTVRAQISTARMKLAKFVRGNV